MLKPAVEPPSIPVDSFDKHFAEVHCISLTPGEALVSSTVFDPLPTPDHLHIVKGDIQATLQGKVWETLQQLQIPHRKHQGVCKLAAVYGAGRSVQLSDVGLSTMETQFYAACPTLQELWKQV